MNDIIEFYTQPVPPGHDHHSRLRQEIAFLEARILTLESDGDCAYERALGRSYNALLGLRRRELASLDA